MLNFSHNTIGLNLTELQDLTNRMKTELDTIQASRQRFQESMEQGVKYMEKLFAAQETQTETQEMSETTETTDTLVKTMVESGMTEMEMFGGYDFASVESGETWGADPESDHQWLIYEPSLKMEICDYYGVQPFVDDFGLYLHTDIVGTNEEDLIRVTDKGTLVDISYWSVAKLANVLRKWAYNK